MTNSIHVPFVPFAIAPRNRRRGLLVAGMVGAALLGGCSHQAPRPEKTAEQARDALNKGQTPRAIALAESAVRSDGRNPALRLLLANAYLRAGRFESARQGFADAIELGDDSARAALGLVMCDLALGHNSAALDTLNTYGDVLQPADLGLALTMAGQQQRGIDVLTNAIRQGQNQPKVRQNLAYAYALAGMWNEARIMAGQDVPADQVNARIQTWAAMSRPEDARRRVAMLVGTPLIGDTGQPEALALAHFPATTPDQPAKALASAAPTQMPPAAASELPPAPANEMPPALAPEPAPAPLASGALARIELHPAVPAAPRAHVTHAPQRVAAVVGNRSTHVVQLGSFNSAESARRAWQHFAARNAYLKGHPSMVTKVNVRGRDFWRLQAAGFNGQASAASLCGTVRAHGGACLVMAARAAAQVNVVQTADARPAMGHGAPQRPVPQHPAAVRPVTVNPARR